MHGTYPVQVRQSTPPHRPLRPPPRNISKRNRPSKRMIRLPSITPIPIPQDPTRLRTQTVWHRSTQNIIQLRREERINALPTQYRVAAANEALQELYEIDGCGEETDAADFIVERVLHDDLAGADGLLAGGGAGAEGHFERWWEF